jgi:hypothetical protein
MMCRWFYRGQIKRICTGIAEEIASGGRPIWQGFRPLMPLFFLYIAISDRADTFKITALLHHYINISLLINMLSVVQLGCSWGAVGCSWGAVAPMVQMHCTP